jgi:hypothetical protein
VDLSGGGRLDSLVGVMDLGPVLREGPPQRGQGQGLVQGAAQMPAADAPGVDVHQHR